MDAILTKKPLTPKERAQATVTICVTGGAGYLASHVIVRLLAAGHTIHATYRPVKDDAITMDFLSSLPGADQRLKWFPADLLQPGSFDTAIRGCEYVVHCAAVVDMGMTNPKGWARCVTPAVQGIENVFASVDRTTTVKRVVLTSSLAAVVTQRPLGHVFTEADWNLIWPTADVPYITSKVVGESLAWALAGQQRRWQLVVLNPVNVWGPAVAPASLASVMVRLGKTLVDGSIYPYFIPIDEPTVDVRDVAVAHALALFTPDAHGRYLLVERSDIGITHILEILRRRYPGYRVPHRAIPKWLARIMCRFNGAIAPSYVQLAYNKTHKISAAKAERELGMTFIPLEETLDDLVDSLVAGGHLAPHGMPKVPMPSSAPAAWPSVVPKTSKANGKHKGM